MLIIGTFNLSLLTLFIILPTLHSKSYYLCDTNFSRIITVTQLISSHNNCLFSIIIYIVLQYRTDDGKNSDFEYPPLTVEKVAIDDNLGVCGNRIVNISHLAGQFRQMANHEQICTGGRFSLIGENRNGFHTTFEFQCVCGATKTVTSDKNETTLNDAAVWGSMSIGIGRTQMEELFSVMNIPVMAAKTFRKHEIKIGKVISTNNLSYLYKTYTYTQSNLQN